MKLSRTFISAVVGALIVSTPASAHVGVGDVHGFMHGFMHPLGGLDHVLAMVAVGMFAANLGKRALWLVPTAFVLMMALGGVLGISHIQIPFVEIGIAMSVIILGLAVAFDLSLPILGAMALVGFFAIFHGHAHGSEMPIDASGATYAAGFMIATALLHVIGMGIGLGVGRIGNATTAVRLNQIGGTAMTLAGVGILAGWL